MTTLRLHGGLHEIHILAGAYASPPTGAQADQWDRLAIRSHADALRLLAPLREATWQLRAALAQEGATHAGRLTEHELLGTAASRLVSGQWRVYRKQPAASPASAGSGSAAPVPARSSASAGSGRPASRPATPPAASQRPPPTAPVRTALPPAAAQPAEAPIQHWIEIELVGEDDKPIPHEAYRVELPDGSVAEGRLDAAGFARLDRLQSSGLCRISFPALDRSAWEFVESLPARAA